MKIATLIQILQKRNQDDEILVPCGENGALTDDLRVAPMPMRHELSAPRRVALLPLEGSWTMRLGLEQELVLTTPRLPGT